MTFKFEDDSLGYRDKTVACECTDGQLGRYGLDDLHCECHESEEKDDPHFVGS